MSRHFLLLFQVVIFIQFVFICVCDETATCSKEEEKCSAKTETKATPTAKPTPNAMKAMFETDEAIENFFQHRFERSIMHLSHSDREDRPAWMQFYRRFIPSDGIDAVMKSNTSVTDISLPLQLHDDVNVMRVGVRTKMTISPSTSSQTGKETKPTEKELFAWMPVSLPVNVDALQASVSDGSVLNLYGMSFRLHDVATFVDSLRAFWAVPVSATFSFHPPGTASMPSPAPGISASDLFIISLDGVASVQTIDGFFPYPQSHHVDSVSVRKSAMESLLYPSSSEGSSKQSSKSNRTWTLDEGDVLYIPRGTAYDIRTKASLAVFLYVHVHTEHRLIYHGLEQAIDIARRTSEILDYPLPSSTSENKNAESKQQPTLADFVVTAVRMAAEFTPAMRRFLPITGEAMSVMDEVGVEVGESLVRDALGRFSRAATSALFDPIMDLLSSDDASDNGAVSAFASPEIISWAKRVHTNRDELLEKAKETFTASIKDISEMTVSPSDVVMSISLDWHDVEKTKWIKELDMRNKCLKIHGQGTVKP